MRYNFRYKGKTYGIDVKKVKGLKKVSGLMFKSKNTEALLFDPASSIHSFFVPFSFLAVWINENDKAIKVEKVRPFRFHVNKKAEKLLEIPINKEHEELVRELQ